MLVLFPFLMYFNEISFNDSIVTAVMAEKIISKPAILIVAEEEWLYHSTGTASWYGPGFQGRKTANGERYNMYDMTAAHKRLKFNTIVKVTNLNNGKFVIVRINDRGPYIRGRIIDLSKTAKQKIMGKGGLCKVKLEILNKKNK